MTTVNQDWPSFREWQTTKLPEPYRTLCAGRWYLREDWPAMRASIVSVTRTIGEALAPAFQALGDAIRQVAGVFRNVGRTLEDAGFTFTDDGLVGPAGAMELPFVANPGGLPFAGPAGLPAGTLFGLRGDDDG